MKVCFKGMIDDDNFIRVYDLPKVLTFMSNTNENLRLVSLLLFIFFVRVLIDEVEMG